MTGRYAPSDEVACMHRPMVQYHGSRFTSDIAVAMLTVCGERLQFW